LEVHSGEEFLALTKDQLIKILRSEELSIEDEYQVFLAAMQWILKDLGKRRKHVVEVLDPIRFPLLPPQRLLKYIEGNFFFFPYIKLVDYQVAFCLRWGSFHFLIEQ
jgi:actin-binding protein IPP